MMYKGLLMAAGGALTVALSWWTPAPAQLAVPVSPDVAAVDLTTADASALKSAPTLDVFGGAFYSRLVEASATIVEETQTGADEKAFSVIEAAQRVAFEAHVRPWWFVEVNSAADVQALQRRYGVGEEWFRAMNPGVDLTQIEPKTRLLFYRNDPAQPASSWGTANRGRLVNGMPMPEGENWMIRDPREAWGTPDVIRYLMRGYDHVGERFPGRSVAVVGDISLARGGRLAPHKSHRTGRDVDAAYYGKEGAPHGGFWNAASPEIDLERNWALFKYWVDQGIVEYIFVDTRIQRALVDYALRSGEDRDEVFAMFQATGGPRAPIRHARGHADHYHVRFRCESWDVNCR